ncbi:MAG TPA: hypothetical protein VFY49_13085 [Myxococcota bacterium]|nr:hypothetical protein [Myxococcota bacterium]
MKPCVFIHSNDKQMVGALVAQYALHRNSSHADAFDVKIIQQENYAFFRDYEGRRYLRDGAWRVWTNDDLQSFTPLRFAPPELMGYQGRALVIDPDIFAVGDVYELLSRDMRGKAILARRRAGWKKKTCWASSVMLLDCSKLQHWRCEADFASLFEGRRDYSDWICLRLEPEASLDPLEDEWNDFDRLSEKTRLLHNTRRWTQPWKTGLPVDFVPGDKVLGLPFVDRLMRWRREWFGDHALLGRYVRHPDRNQERFFFGLLRECLDRGAVSESLLREEIRRNHVRHDAFEVLDRTPPLPA